MRNKVIATTTNSIENAEVEKYIDLVSTNVVIGTNFFSDLGASFTDLFGGYSDSYQGKLQKIYFTAIDNLKLKAANIGANAILGLKIDFDEISGKGKSMFMISALGTAVSMKFIKQETNESTKIENLIISNERVEQEVIKRNIITKLKNNKLPSQEDWIYLLNNPINEVSEQILESYLSNIHHGTSEVVAGIQLLLTNTISYFKSLDREISIKTLYEKLIEKPIPILKIIEENNLFAPLKIIELIKNDNIDIAIDCLSANKEYYSISDLHQMKTIIELLNNLPDKGKIETVKGLIGKSKEKFICQHGHSSNVDSEYCENFNCGENIKGLTEKKVKQIEAYTTKVNSLSTLMKENE